MVFAEFMIFGFVENEGDELGFEYHISRFGLNSSFGGGFERDKSRGFNQRSGDFWISEVLDFAERKTFKIVCENCLWSTWMFSMEFLNEFL